MKKSQLWYIIKRPTFYIREENDEDYRRLSHSYQIFARHG